MKPTKVNIQAFVKPYLHTDERGAFLIYDEAELMLDKMVEDFAGITMRYLFSASGREELVITSAAGRSERPEFSPPDHPWPFSCLRSICSSSADASGV